MNSLRKILIGSTISLGLLAGAAEARPRYSHAGDNGYKVYTYSATNSPAYGGRELTKKEEIGLAIGFPVMLFLAGWMDWKRRHKFNGGNMNSIVRRVPEDSDYSGISCGGLFGGISVSHESPETAIARRRPDIASGVLSKGILASTQIQGTEKLAEIASSYSHRTDVKRIRMRTAASERNFLGIPVRTYGFQGEVDID